MKRKRNVTQRDIARVVGCSQRAVATVVGTGSAVSGVGAEKRARILEVARKLGYRPVRSAQLIRGVKSGLIGYVKNVTMHEHLALQTLYLGRAVEASGYNLIAVDVLWERHGIEKALEFLYDSKVEGLLLSQTQFEITEAKAFDLFRSARIPCVTLNVPEPGNPVRFPSVHADHFQGMTDLVRHLLDQGCERIVLLMSAVAYTTTSERERAYIVAMREAGLEPDILRVPPEDHVSNLVESYTVAQRGIDLLVARGRLPDAVCCGNDLIAHAALMRLRRHGVAVPRDLALAGFDHHALSVCCEPPITTVEQPTREIAERAVDLLTRLIAGKRLAPTERHVVLPCRLHCRASTERAGPAAGPRGAAESIRTAIVTKP